MPSEKWRVLPGTLKVRVRDGDRGDFQSACKAYLRFIQFIYSPFTVRGYTCSIARFCKFLAERNKSRLGPRCVSDFFVWLNVDQAVTGSAIRPYRVALSSMFRWCLNNGLIDHNPMNQIPAGFVSFAPKRKQPVASPEEYAKLKMAALGSPMYYGIVCAWHTSWRLSDVCLLKWESVDLKGGTISIQPIKTKKRGTTAEVPIHPELRELLEIASCMREGEYVSPELAKFYTRDQSTASYMFRVIAKKAGLSHLHFHSLRHTALTRWMESPHADVVTVMNMSGHTSADMLARYVRPSMDKKRKILGL